MIDKLFACVFMLHSVYLYLPYGSTQQQKNTIKHMTDNQQTKKHNTTINRTPILLTVLLY